MMADMKLPAELTELQHPVMVCDAEAIEIVVNLHVFFDDYQKIFLWLTTKNPHFGDIAPLRLMQIGKGKKVLSFILQAEWERDFGNDDGS